MLKIVFSGACLRVRLSWSSQILLGHVLDLRTPLLRQGDVTDSFLIRLFHTFILRWLWTVLAVCITCYSWAELLFILFRFGGSVFCVSSVFVRSRRENLLLLSWQSLLHVHSLSRYFFICVTGRPVGLIVLRTFLKGAMSPHTHARVNENKLENVGPSFSCSVGDFGRLFLSV